MNKTKKYLINGNKAKGLKISIFLLLSFVTLSFFSCSEITAPADAFPPATPNNLSVLGGDGQALFRWEKNTEPDLKAYRLYRSENNKTNFSLLKAIIQTETYDRGLNYDSTYYYYLTAIDNAGNESSPTDIREVKPINTVAPERLSRINVAGFNDPLRAMGINISWVPPDIGDLKNYKVYRGSESTFVPDASTFVDSTDIAMYVDRLVQLNQKYYYKIIAFDKGGLHSDPSIAASDIILSRPVIVSPENNTIFSPRIFQWNGVTSAINYVVFVGNGPFSDIIWSSNKTTSSEINYSGPALQSGKYYYCWVGAYSKDKVILDDSSELPAQINSYSLANQFKGE